MSYIYRVKPFKECIKIAVESDDLHICPGGRVTIHAIGFPNWPEGEVVRTKERQTSSIKTKTGLWVPLRYFTEVQHLEPEAPEFIKGLYDAMSASCGNIRCEKCPLDITGDCKIFTKFIRDNWSIEE